jgi:hypothetical protein
MTDSNPLNERIWEQGWEGHELAQKRRMAALTLAQKLEWLEEAQRIVEHLQKGRASQSSAALDGPRRDPAAGR